MAEMTKRERILAAAQGKAVDRVPASFFGHNHAAERTPETLAPHLVEQNRRWDWDIIKVNLKASYYGEAWGNTYEWDAQNGHQLKDYVIKSAEDMKRLKRLDSTRGPFGEQVEVARLLGETLKGSVPYVQTVFSPLSVAARLSGSLTFTPQEPQAVQRFMQTDADALHLGLVKIAQTLADYARACVRAGADGIFFATTVWSRDTISEEQYKIFGIPYDLVVLNAAIGAGATINVLHLCREDIMLELLGGYPVQIISYDSTTSRNPSLKAALSKTNKALWSGVDHKATLIKGPVSAVIAQTQQALEETNGRRFILGPGCTAQPVPDAHYAAIRETLAQWRPR